MDLKSLLSRFRSMPNYFEEYKAKFACIYGDVLSKLEEVGADGLVSVVLPVYNGEAYLSEAIDSVLAQTYSNVELIIVNDGSVDQTERIALEYRDKYPNIKYIKNEVNRRLPAALNTGFAAARGQYYTWLSHDNIMLPEFVRTMVKELEVNREAAMVYGNMRLIDEKGKILRGKGWYEIPPLSGNVILPQTTAELNDVANNTVGAAFMYRAKAAAFLGGYDEARFGIEDYDYWMRMNEVFKIIHAKSAEPLYLYRFHDGSLTARDRELKITENRPKLMSFDKERRHRIVGGIKQGSLEELKRRMG